MSDKEGDNLYAPKFPLPKRTLDIECRHNLIPHFMFEKIYHLNGYNKELLIKTHQLAYDSVFFEIIKIISEYIGNFRFAPITIPVIALITYFSFKLQKNDRTIPFCAKSFKCFIVMFFSFIIMAIIVKFLKSNLSMPRPFCSIEPDLIKNLAIHKPSKCFRSFPSGHTAYTSVILFSLWPIMNRAVKYFGAALLLTVAMSRVAMAMHYPFDVASSVIISIIATSLIHKVVNKFEHRFKDKTFDICKCLTK